MSIYARIITEQLGKLRRQEIDPRHVEAHMRCQYGTLGHLDRKTFNREVKLAVCVIDAAPEQGEPLARSYGLFPCPADAAKRTS